MKIPFTNIRITMPASFVEPTPTPTAALPGVSMEQANQRTKPTRPLAEAFPREELGDSGTRMLHGIITEEYNPQLQGVQGIRVYDEMRKSDGTVRAAILACTLPIRRAQWFVNPATDDPQDVEIANFVEHALFDWLDITWDDVLRQTLLMVSFGVMPFEKVYGIKEHDGKSYVIPLKLAPRLPKSILQWELPDRTFGIQQIRQDGILAMIPGSKLLIFINEREGDNWWGTSMLRAAYKHWYYKNNFYKIDAVAFERQGLGIPKITMPQGYTESDEKLATKAMQNLRANENAYLLLPTSYTAEFMNMGSMTTRDPQNSINHHNKEILQSVLAQFLELGVSNSKVGSKALSSDHSDLFLKGVEAIANTIIAEFNKDLIREMVDLNFNNVKVYPKLDYSGISKVDMQALGEAYSKLVVAGALTPTTDDEQYIRAALGLPARTQDDIEEETDGEPSTEDLVDHRDIVDIEKPGEVEVETEQTPAQKKKTEAALKKKNAHEPHNGRFLKRTFTSQDDGFQSWRPFTFAEETVTWKKIQDTMDSMEADFTAEATALLNDAKDKFMSKLQTALADGDQKAIAALEVGFVNDYKSLLKKSMKSAYEYGKNNVSTHMGIQPPPNTAESLATMDMMADTIANKTAVDLETKAKLAIANSITQNKTQLQALGTVDAALEEAIKKAVQHTGGILVGQNINGGRNDVFQRNRGMIYALQRSEVLDERTCEFCLSMDGLIVTPDDSWASTDVFHENCRGIWVEILTDELNPPDITGVPSEVGDYYGGTPNDLVQPRNAIVRPDSPAAAELERRKEEKASSKK